VATANTAPDAALIVNAPDLLAAARAVVEWADEQGIGIPVRTGLKDVIAKAEGGA